MDWPLVTILIVTYDRPDEIRRTLAALVNHLHYSGELRWHIADDGTPGSYLDDLRRDFPVLNLARSVTQRGGWGVNVNTALRAATTDLVFLCEDDYVAQRAADLDRGVIVLAAQPGIGLVRYDGIGGHVGMNLWLCEARQEERTVNYLEIDRRHSAHLNVYSNRPHLKHRRFHDAVGYYAEGLSLGFTEESFAHRVKDADPGCGVAILGDGIEYSFDHIGKSRQGTDADPNRG
jgi:glycosyltransferase involved in cell wall biosynthesis